jgi:hypothetical protein
VAEYSPVGSVPADRRAHHRTCWNFQLPKQPTTEELRLAILAAARESNLDLVHKLTVAFHRALGREEGERSADGTRNSGRVEAQDGSALRIPD